MKRKMKRRVLSLLLGMGLLCVFSTAVYAHEIPDAGRTGSVTIEMRYDGKALDGGRLEIYRVGEVRENNGDYTFVKTAAFQSFRGTLENLQSEALAKQLKEYAKEKQIPAAGSGAAEDGRVVFDKLEPGLYLAVQTEAAQGYSLMNPFLVSVPLWQDGAYQYDITAIGKFELKKEPAPDTPPTPTPPKLPQTGQLNWPVPILTASGMILFAAGWVLRFCRRKEYDT